MEWNQIIEMAYSQGPSDVHIKSGFAPYIRKAGNLEPLDVPALSPLDVDHVIHSMLDENQKNRLAEGHDLDFSLAQPGVGRLRVNVYRDNKGLAAAVRFIPEHVKPFADLDLPLQLANLAHKHKGLVLVTGPTGSGKTTTLAALIDLINKERACHILTLEDPIEFVHESQKAIISQREIGRDVKSFAAALRSALREDPDVILVGELRDLETIQLAITAAETGHLVFGTLHTMDAPSTVDRLIDVFPAEQQDQVRTQLSSALQAVIAQSLMTSADQTRRYCALEIMMMTHAIANLIREGKTHQISSSIQMGVGEGMQTMAWAAKTLIDEGKITKEEALSKLLHGDELRQLL